MAKEDFSLSFGLGLLGGIIGGVIAGALLAPQAGEKTRQEVKEVLVSAKEKYGPKIIETQKETCRALEIIKCRIEKQIRKINSALKARQLAKAKIIENGNYEMN